MIHHIFQILGGLVLLLGAVAFGVAHAADFSPLGWVTYGAIIIALGALTVLSVKEMIDDINGY